MMLPLTLLLFCRPQHVPVISRALEDAAIFLEHPLSYDPAMHHGARYANPHNPARVGEADRRRRELIGSAGGIGGIGYPYAQRTSAARTVEAQQEQVQAVFKSLRSGVDMDEVEPPGACGRHRSDTG
jgi:hypothetical protein